MWWGLARIPPRIPITGGLTDLPPTIFIKAKQRISYTERWWAVPASLTITLGPDKRDDYITNEVTTDYNAGFTGVLAYMVDKFGGAPLPDSEIPKLFDPASSSPSPQPSPSPSPNPSPAPSPTPDPVPSTPPMSGDVGVDFSVTNDWGSGFQGQIAIANQSDSQMNGWTLEFEFANEITQIWNAEIVSHTGNTYVIRDVGWNSGIAPNGSISFGFIGEGSATEPRSIELNGQLVGTPASTSTSTPDPISTPPLTPTPDPILTPAPNSRLELNKTDNGRGAYYAANHRNPGSRA